MAAAPTAPHLLVPLAAELCVRHPHATILIENLREIESLLRKHGYVGQANAVARVITAEQAGDRVAFAREVTGLGFWGGAGSVADADLRYNSPRPPEEAAADVPRLRQYMVALADALEHEGLATQRTRDVASTFRYWLAQGV